jgi:hypothetical protein
VGFRRTARRSAVARRRVRLSTRLQAFEHTPFSTPSATFGAKCHEPLPDKTAGSTPTRRRNFFVVVGTKL